MSSAAIRPFEADDLDAVCSLYARVFGEGAMQRFRRRFRWQFFDNPSTDVLPSRMWVADLEGAVVGFVASFPAKQKVFDEEIVIRRTCDLMIAPSSRAVDPTVAIRLLGTLRRNGAGDTLWVGVGYSPQHRKMRELLGHQPVDMAPFYIRPYDVRSIVRSLNGSGRSRVLWSRPPGSWVINGLGMALNAATAAVNAVRRPRAPRGYSVEEVDKPAGPEFDELWQAVGPAFPIVAVRDRRFVQWRFFDDPVFDNTTLLARSAQGEPVGYLAMRVSSKGPMRMGRILDVFCSPESEAVVEALMHAALAKFRREGADAVSCFGLHPAIRKTVRRYLYLAPASRQSPALAVWNGEPALRDAVYDANNWHMSHADGDDGFSP